MKRIACLLGFVVAALSLAAPAVAENYIISQGVWSHYQGYLRKIGSYRPGAFAITRDGGGAFYVWCPDTRCVPGPSYRFDAIQSCEREYGTTCIAFADRDSILVPYTLAEAMPASSAAPDLAQPSVTRITLSPSARDEMAQYLEYSKTTGKAWALVIAKDGSKAVGAGCPTSGGAGYRAGGGSGPGCDLNLATAQELAEKKAMQSCGGPASCVVLYRGLQKVANIEIVN